MARFTLERGRWYGWSMYPGYGYSGPYFSPIRVVEVRPLGTGKSLMQLRFFNVNYAAGVQMFEVSLRILYRAPDHMLAALVEDDDKPPERTAVISPLTWAWLKACDPHHRFDKSFKDAEQAATLYYQKVTF